MIREEGNVRAVCGVERQDEKGCEKKIDFLKNCWNSVVATCASSTVIFFCKMNLGHKKPLIFYTANITPRAKEGITKEAMDQAVATGDVQFDGMIGEFGQFSAALLFLTWS